MKDDLNGSVGSAGSGDANSLFFTINTRVGNLILPLFPISTATDMFQQTCNALNPIAYSGCQDPDPLRVINKLQGGTLSFSEYSRVARAPVLNPVRNAYGVGTGGCLFAFSFERSSAVNIGSLSTNNARVLSIEVNNMARATDFQCIASVVYLQVANCSNENVVINK